MTPLSRIKRLFFAGQRRQAVALARTAAFDEPKEDHLRALATVEMAIGNTEGAIRALELAREQSERPCLEVLNDLGACRAELGQYELALECFRGALELDGVATSVLNNWGAALLRLDRFEEAQSAFERGWRISRQPRLGLGLVRSWGSNRRPRDAEKLLAAILGAGVCDFDALDVMLELGLFDRRTRLEWVDRAWKRNPAHQGLAGLRLRALSSLLPTDARLAVLRLMDELVDVQLSGESIATLDSVSATLLDLPSMRRQPESHATCGGQHSGDIFAEPGAELGEFQALLETVIKDGLRARGGDSHGQFELHAWGVAMERTHRQTVHFHPEATYSGCLYLSVPRGLNESAQDGHLAFHGSSGVVRTICPRPGRVVLFPSCLDHSTIPFTSDGRRVSVAFDLIARK